MILWGKNNTFTKITLMKYIITVFIFSIVLAISNAQVKAPSPSSINISKDTVGIFNKVEVEAGFTGGDTAWRSFLMRNLNIDKISDKVKFTGKQKVFQQTVIVKFIVCTDGSLCDIKTENKVDPLIKAEAERVIKISPNWTPAIVDGKPVKAYRRQPITVLIERE
jgi:periplasmic protein TonB